MPITLSLRHCSNKYKLAREGEKEKDEDFEKSESFFFFLWSQVELKEMSFQLLLENWRIQHSGWGWNNALYFISNKWPLTSSHSFFFSPIPLCLPQPGLIFQNTQSHVLMFISSWDSDLCVISFTSECSHMDKCVLFVFILWFLR